MKSIRVLTVLVLAVGLILSWPKPSEAAQMGTAFTYQGHLYDANHVANGLYDFTFKLYDAGVAGNKVATDVNVADVDVIDSYFTVELDFGSVFDGNKCWLEIGVRPGEQSDPCEYTTLSPRQEITPAPDTIYAETAGSVKGGIGWSEVSDRPAGLDDGDDVGITSETDPQVGSNTTNCIPKWDGSALITGTIYDNGKVGVGTTSPSAKLHINGPDLSSEAALIVYQYSSAPVAKFRGGADLPAIIRVGKASSGGANNYGAIELGIDGSLATIAGKNGNVGIGTTNPARSLHISDVMRLQPRATAPSSPVEGDIYMNSTTHKLMVYDGTTWQSCW